VYNQGDRRANDRILWDQILQRTMPRRNVFGYSGDDTHNNEQLFRNYNFMLMSDLTTDDLKQAMRKGASYFCYEPKGSGEAKAPRVTAIDVDEENMTITIHSNGLVHWIYATDKTSTAASSTRSTVVGIGNTFCYKGYQGSYVRAYITNVYGETCTQPISFIDKNSVGVEDVFVNPLSIMVYPNPTTDLVNVFMNEYECEKLIRVYDVNGREVMVAPVQGAVTPLSVRDLSSGIYLLHSGNRTARFIKE
jgi:hypothetical protein